KMGDSDSFARNPLSGLGPIWCHISANRRIRNPLIERQALPESALLSPVRLGGDGPNMVLADRITALGGARQEQDRLLDVRRELQQVHDLRHPGAGHVAQTRQV